MVHSTSESFMNILEYMKAQRQIQQLLHHKNSQFTPSQDHRIWPQRCSHSIFESLSFSIFLNSHKRKQEQFTYPSSRSDISNKMLLHSACSKRQIRAVPSLLPLMNLSRYQKFIHFSANILALKYVYSFTHHHNRNFAVQDWQEWNLKFVFKRILFIRFLSRKPGKSFSELENWMKLSKHEEHRSKF